MSGPLPVARVPRPQMPDQYDPALLEAAFQALERDLVRRFTRQADLALEPGKRLVLAGSGGNTQYALGLDNDGGLTVTNYLTGAEGELIVDWAQVDGAAARDLQIAALEAVADGLSDTYATVTALASVESSLEGSIASLSSGVSASFAATNANVSTNASAIATVQGAAAYYNVEVAAAGSDPAMVTLRAGASGSEIGLISRIIRLKNIVGSTTVEVMRAVGGLVFFSNPISMDFAGRRLTLGPGFGVSGQEVIFWFGPDTTAPSAQSRTNGYFAFGSNGVPYFGTAALSWGATAAEAAASNAFVPQGQNRCIYPRGEKLTSWQNGIDGHTGVSMSQFDFLGYIGVRLAATASAANKVCYLEHGANSSAVRIPCVPGERLAVACEIETTNCASGSIIAIAFNTSGTLVLFSAIASWTGNQSYVTARSGFVTVPGNTREIYLRFTHTSAASGALVLNVSSLRVSGATSAQTAIPPWSEGRITEALADVTIDTLPANVSVSNAATFNPVYPLSSSSSSSISVAATTITIPGRTITTGSATISGLSASTIYSVFYDTQTSSFVALATGTSSYFASLTRYIAFGSQATQAGGGGYPSPPAPPGGGGGGAGRGDYVP